MISLERQARRKSHEAKTSKLGTRILKYTGTIGPMVGTENPVKAIREPLLKRKEKTTLFHTVATG